MHVESNRAVTFTLIPILLTKHACKLSLSSLLEFLRYFKIKFKAVVKHDLTLWCEVFKIIARTITWACILCTLFDCTIPFVYNISGFMVPYTGYSAIITYRKFSSVNFNLICS